ncbi:unnamed protein product [Arctia plantaginis]|uniref:Uncharacterized protein n=1 Tax=Arctia plantaginis TaxID=874455 RepID=A0A8S1BBE1_ARCPL|nr:unnamed protein product [Arctia plantaginis]CAB3254362.1 unnamed protein product [Arctia plantaginis]
MNTTATTFSSDHSWSRRCSTETVFSIQGKETDYARDTSDTEALPLGASDDSDVEYEPVTESEDEDKLPVDGDTSAQSDNEIISTKVIEVSVGDDGELQFADSEQTETYETDDSEMDLIDYWNCVQCHAENNNPLYRYCQKCFQVRKNFFPPRPKRKKNRETKTQNDSPTIDEIPRTLSQELEEIPNSLSQELEEIPSSLSQDSGIPRTHSQESDAIPRTLSQDSGVDSPHSQETQYNPGEGTSNTKIERSVIRCKKRGSDYPQRNTKRRRVSHTDSETDLSSDDSKSVEIVRPLVKTVSDPAITIEDVDVKITKKVIANTLIEKLDTKDLCVVCVSEPKSGVFVHGRIAHICCCYKCAVKVWAKSKRCPVCNCKVSNVLRAIIM